ncbi:MAG: DUF4252 domain-containing protein [Cyclobacteriaceae bacterium]
MKKVLFFAAFIIMPLCANAQGSPVDKLFEKYSGREGYTSVYISKYMFSLFADMENSDKEIENVLGNLTGIRILASEEAFLPGVNFYAEIMEELPINEYKELMVVKEKGQDFKFLIRENDGMISELLMVAGGASNNALISIQGNIDLNTISKLSKSMDIEGMDALEKIE